MTRILQRIYIGLFLVDGLLSLMTLFFPELLAWSNVLLAFSVVLLSLPLWGIVVLSQRFSPWLLIPAWFALWANCCRAFPLNLSEDMAWVDKSLIIAQLCIGAGCLFLWSTKRGSRSFFAWRHTLVTGLLSLVAAVCLLVTLICGQAVNCISTLTANYVRVTFQGLYLKEKSFAKDGREVRLIGMMHIGKDEFYQKVVDSLPKDKPGLVLLEGVTNKKKTEVSLDYKNLATRLGVGSQRESKFQETAQKYLEAEQEGKTNELENPKLEFRSGDLDLADFHPATIRFLGLVGRLYESRNLHEFLTTYREIGRDRAAQQWVMSDILDRRNLHLLYEIDNAKSPLVIVPWGALHMKFLEKELLRRGYHEVSQSENQALAFGK